MNKRLLSLAVVAIAALGIMAVAGTKSKASKSDKAQTETTEQQGKQCCKGKQGCDSIRHCGPEEFNPFIGITLTDDQKAQLEALKPQDKGCPCCGGGNKPCEAKAKPCAPAKCDSINGAERPDPRQAKRDYLNKIKEILTPEQYVVFLENAVVSQPDNAGRPGEGRPGEGGRHGRHGQPGEGRPAPGPDFQPGR
jgi:hypothetical protein